MKIVCAVCSVEQERADRCVECQRPLPGGVGLSPGARPKGVGEFDEGVDLVWKRIYGHLYTNVRWRVRRHSTSGMEVGSMGSGCADFALNVMVALYPAGNGENIKIWQGHVSCRAWALHQDFQVKFLASANRDEGRIPWAKITEWIEAQCGETCRSMERYEEALADFIRAIEPDENDAWAIANRGETHRLMKRYEEALADLTRAIELDENDAWALASRGVTYRLMERYEEALADSVSAVELDAEETTAHLSIIACYRKLGWMEEYQRQVEIARSVIAKESVYIRACFAAVCGDTENTLALLRRALEAKDEPIHWAMMDPDFDCVREDPRFATLLDETKALLY